jgi:hypothetical protein
LSDGWTDTSFIPAKKLEFFFFFSTVLLQKHHFHIQLRIEADPWVKCTGSLYFIESKSCVRCGLPTGEECTVDGHMIGVSLTDRQEFFLLVYSLIVCRTTMVPQAGTGSSCFQSFGAALGKARLLESHIITVISRFMLLGPVGACALCTVVGAVRECRLLDVKLLLYSFRNFNFTGILNQK